MTDKDPNIKCVICGVKASGQNYTVLSCLSCKTFFQRNHLRAKEFECKFDGNCNINHISRKWCKRCRINKCLAMGMKKDSLVAKQERGLNITISKERKACEQSVEESEAIVDSTTHSDSDLNSDKDILDEIIETNSFNDIVVKAEEMEVDNFLAEFEISYLMDELKEKQTKLEFSIMPIIRPITAYNNNFTEFEGKRITELLESTQCLNKFLCPVAKKYHPFLNVIEPNSFINMATLKAVRTEQEIPYIVKMSKNLSLFRDNCVDDQISLLKFGSMDVLSLRLLKSVDPEQHTLHFHGKNDSMAIIRLDILKDCTRNLYELATIFLDTIFPIVDSDPIILDLLSAIVLFNPNQQSLTYSHVVKYQQYVYMYLLQRYLTMKYQSESKSKSKFLTLMKCLEMLKHIKEKVAQMIIEESDQFRAIVGPLVKEIFDMQ